MDALVDSSKSISWCATRRCPGSVTEVADYLSARFVDDATVTTRSGRLTVVPGALRGVATVGPVRVRRAKLSFGAWRSARVTIEVEPWSRSESELLVRPTRRRPVGERAYFTAVLAVLESLAGRDRHDPDAGVGDRVGGAAPPRVVGRVQRGLRTTT